MDVDEQARRLDHDVEALEAGETVSRVVVVNSADELRAVFAGAAPGAPDLADAPGPFPMKVKVFTVEALRLADMDLELGPGPEPCVYRIGRLTFDGGSLIVRSLGLTLVADTVEVLRKSARGYQLGFLGAPGEPDENGEPGEPRPPQAATVTIRECSGELVVAGQKGRAGPTISVSIPERLFGSLSVTVADAPTGADDGIGCQVVLGHR